MTEQAGVTAVPLSAFFSQKAASRHIRFCFAKTEAILREAQRRLVIWNS